MPPEVELEYLRSPSREASENNHQGDVRGLITNNATLIPFVGMVRLTSLKQWRRRIIAAIFRVASCVSRVTVDSMPKRAKHAMKVAFEKILAATTLG